MGFSKNTGVGCHALLQGIFPTQGLNLGLLRLLHCRGILYHQDTREALLRPLSIFHLFFKNLFFDCCMDFFLVVVSGGYSLVAVPGLLIAVSPLVVEHRR